MIRYLFSPPAADTRSDPPAAVLMTGYSCPASSHRHSVASNQHLTFLPIRHVLYGFHDFLVSRAAAQVSGNRPANLGFVRLRVALQ